MKKKILIAVGLAMLMLLFISSAFAAHEHTFGDWVWSPGKMPTCQKKGQQERVCTQTGCSKHEYRPVNTVPHEFDPATCTKPKTCKFKCGTTSGSAPGHKFTIPANCVRKKNVFCLRRNRRRSGQSYFLKCNLYQKINLYLLWL